MYYSWAQKLFFWHYELLPVSLETSSLALLLARFSIGLECIIVCVAFVCYCAERIVVHSELSFRIYLLLSFALACRTSTFHKMSFIRVQWTISSQNVIHFSQSRSLCLSLSLSLSPSIYATWISFDSFSRWPIHNRFNSFSCDPSFSEIQYIFHFRFLSFSVFGILSTKANGSARAHTATTYTRPLQLRD